MGKETRMIATRDRRAVVKLEIDGNAPDMGVWEILDKFREVTEGAKRTDVAIAMSAFMGRPVTRQMVERWFGENPMLPRTDYFLALVAVLSKRFRVVEFEDPPAEPKRPRGRPRLYPPEVKKMPRPRGRPRKEGSSDDESDDA